MSHIRFSADSSLLGHATLLFPGDDLARAGSGAGWHFVIQPSRVQDDTLFVTQLDGDRPVSFEVGLKAYSPRDFGK
jgi:hypothetical protein